MSQPAQLGADDLVLPRLRGGEVQRDDETRYEVLLDPQLGHIERVIDVLGAQREQDGPVDGDGEADKFETFNNSWGYNGNYHQFAFGLIKDKEGNFCGTLCLAHKPDNSGGIFMGTQKETPYRGCSFKITPKGEFIPWSYGLRAPNGIAINDAGDLFATDNQGEFVPVGSLHHLTEGAFHGHPSSLIFKKGWARPLNTVTDPHNLGACLRVANAAGAHAVIAPKDRAAGITPAVSKVASGAAEATPYLMVTNLARTLRELKERHVWIVGAEEGAPQSLYDAQLPDAIAWVLGAEGEGMRRLTRENCDLLVSIPMGGEVESLNVSVSAGVCLFESVRRRTSAQRAGQTRMAKTGPAYTPPDPTLIELKPEALDYSTMTITAYPGYELRPESLESAYYLYRLTRDERYRRMGGGMFEAIERWTRSETGFAALADVRTKEKRDRMHSFLFAETLKYAYLLFAPPSTLDLRAVVFNTEAHPLRRTW